MGLVGLHARGTLEGRRENIERSSDRTAALVVAVWARKWKGLGVAWGAERGKERKRKREKRKNCYGVPLWRVLSWVLVGAWGCVVITDKDTCCSDIAPLPSTVKY